MIPIVRPGWIGVGILASHSTALDHVAASVLWPGVFRYETKLDRILAAQVFTPITVPRS